MFADYPYSAKTVVQYNSCITSIRRLYLDKVKDEFVIPTTFQDSDTIMKLLLETYKKTTTMNFVSAILWKLREIDTDVARDIMPLYHEQAKLLKADIERDKIGKECELTEKEKKSFMLWEDVQQVYANIAHGLNQKDYNSFLDFVVVSLYVIHPPVRADYEHMRVFVDESHVPDDIKGNYCVLHDDPRFVFQEYKNAKYKGTTVIPIEKELHDILLAWVELNKSEYLLSSYFPSSKKYKPFSDATLSQRVTQIFMSHAKRPVSINTLRHSFISYMARHDQEYTKKCDNAEKMMHSVAMADQYRRMVYLS